MNNLKETVAPVCVWLKVVWLERAKIGEELLSVFNISTVTSTFNKCKQKRSASEKKGLQIAMFF
jgi:hypothetical protein